ncbi:MAG TPA: hypothetical protein VIX38_07000 [Nitrososphaeraceae archaeon]
MPKKKEKVVTLRMDEDSFKTVEDYAKGKGLSVGAYINSVLDSYTEWFIPLASNEKIAIPKKALYQLFSYASKESLDNLVQEWADQPKNALRLLGGEFNFESALNSVSKISKYLMGTDARIVTTQQKNIWIVIRHNMGENFSYFWNRIFIHFFGLLQDQVDIVTEYDDTTISIRLKEL